MGEEQPALNAQLVSALVAVIIAIILAFKPGSITDDQRNALIGAVPVVWLFVAGLLQAVKQNTKPLAEVRSIKSAAWQMGHERSGVYGAAVGVDTEPTLAQVEIYARRNNIRSAA